MGPGVLVTEDGGVEAGIEDPAFPRPVAVDFAGDPDGRADRVTQDAYGQTVAGEPGGGVVEDWLAGVDAAAAGYGDQLLASARTESWSSCAAASMSCAVMGCLLLPVGAAAGSGRVM